MLYNTPVDMPNELDPFGNTGTVKQVTGGFRIGKATSNNIPLLNSGQIYQFCIWIKLQTYVTGDTFEIDIANLANLSYVTNKDGLMIKAYGGVGKSGSYLSNEWQRICMNANHTTDSNYNFIDVGVKNSGKSFLMYGMYLAQVKSTGAEPLPYISNTKYHDGQCQYCSHYSRTGANCACSPGYYEVSEGSIECHSPKPSECEKYIRIESAGLMISNPDRNSDYAHFYMNDQVIGNATNRGFNFIVLDQDLNLSDQQVFDVLGNPAKVTEMINYINQLSTGTIVLIAINDEASGNMTTAGYEALQSLGLNQYTRFYYRDAFAMIGKKGAIPGTVKQVVGRLVNKGRANLVGCLKCSSSCFSCIDEFNQFPILENIYTYGNPVLNPTLSDFQGQLGNVFEIIGSNGGSLVRFGKFTVNDKPVDQIFKGKIYQFSLWIRLKSGQIQNNFEFDIIDRRSVRYLSDENGSILEIIGVNPQLGNNLLTEQWQRLVVNALHDNDEHYHFIDVGQSDLINYEISHPQLFEIPHINYPPVRHVQPNSPQTGCYKCLHYARVPPLCECTEGYSESVSGATECSSPIPDTCSKYVRIESAGTNYGQYDIGDYLRIYMNDVSYGTFTQGITLIVLNKDTLYKESQKNYNSSNTTFNPSNLISDINSIEEGKKVLVGIRDDGSQNLNEQVYTALQTLGMDQNTKITYRDGFAMIGTKGLAPGTAKQQIGILLKGSKANIAQCLYGCDYQCETCSNEPYSCNTCSHSTRDINNNCLCKDTYYNLNTNTECQSCNSPCLNCSSIQDCTSCIEGYFLQDNRCIPCDRSKCATCENNSQNCILPCNQDCKTCIVNQSCDSCNQGSFLIDGTCPVCDNTKCATCNGQNDNCDLVCRDTCITCNNDSTCLTCELQKFVDSNGDCLDCDNTKCATCSNVLDNCDLNCNPDCLTCLPNQKCKSCEKGKYLQNGQCLACDNKVCATCITDSITCDIPCGSTCKTCDPNSECQTCNDGYFLQNFDKTCQICNKSKCGTCINQNDECIINCHSSCLTCKLNGDCMDCPEGYFLDGNTCSQCDNTICATCSTNSITCNLHCDNSCQTCDIYGKCLKCLDNQYVDVNKQLCKNCNYTCSKCQINSNNCLECSDEFRDLDKNCLCIDGYFEQNIQNKECLKCDQQCNTCKDNSSNCQTCIDDSRSNPPECSCADKYYQDNQTGTCLPCKQDCLCNQDGICIECKGNTPDKRQLPYCNCKNGYFQNQMGDCQKCSYKCLTCINQEDLCIVCANGLYRNQQAPSCQCQDGYFSQEENLNCQQCYFGCLTCSSYDICTGNSCKVPEFKLPYCKSSSQDVGFSIIINQGQSNEQTVNGTCKIQCASCQIQASQCTSCVIGINRQINIPNCECIPGYHDNDNTTKDCYECSKNCVTCQNYNKCSSCNPKLNRILNNLTLQCVCKKGFIQQNNNQTSICVPCYYYQGECFQQCPQETIQDDKNRICQDIVYNLSQNNSMVYIILVVVLITYVCLILILKICSSRKMKILNKNNKQFQINYSQLDIQKIGLSKSSQEKNSHSNSEENA